MADKSILLALAALPVVIILLIVYLKDKNKEPMALLIKLFLSGFVACTLVLLLSDILAVYLPFMRGTLSNKTFLETLLYAFFGVALVEEFCKWLMTYLIGYNNREFDELYDGMVYAIFVSLGFAFIENIMYVIQTASISTAILRAVSAVPSHACDAIFMGYYMSVAKHCALRKSKEGEKKYLIKSLFIPAILHGIYDFCLMSGYNILIAVFLVFVVVLYVLSIQKLKKLLKYNKKIKFQNKFCHVCGKAVTGPFCAKCGTKQY